MIGRALLALGLSALSASSFASQEWLAEIRARAVHIEEQDRNGRANSLLLRAGLLSEWNDSISSIVELEHVETGWDDDHSDGVRFNGEPFLPDVGGTELNQLALTLKHNQWQLVLGRQVIELDDQRFIGSNGFWQNEQSFDAIALRYDFLSSSRLQYFHIANANRIFGDDADDALAMSDVNYGSSGGQRPAAQLGDHEHSSHVLHVHINEWDFSQVRAYYLDIDNRDLPNSSNQTFGVAYDFEKRVGGINWRAELEYAQQKLSEFEQANPSYYNAELGIGFRSQELSLKREVVGSDNGQSFVTPLASLHDFHGWADKFSAVPGVGLVDQSLKYTWREAPVKFDLRHHWFESEASGVDWGRELDLDFIVKLDKHQRFLLRFADYRSSSVSRANFPSETRVFFNYIVEL